MLVAQLDPDPERPLATAIDLPLTATYLRASTGRIGIDPYLDTVALVEDEGVRSAVYLQDPTQHNVVQEIAAGTDVIDVAVLNGANGADRDPILVLRSSGLQIQECATGVNSQLPVARPVLASWAGAQGVWSGYRATGRPVALGLGLGGRTITKWDWTAGNLVKQSNDITVPTGITKMMTVDFDGTGEVEIVVLYPSVLYVLSWTGTVLQYLPFTGNGNVHMTVSRGTGPAPHGRDLVVACGEVLLPSNQVPQHTLFAFHATQLNVLPMTIPVGDLTAADGPTLDGLEDIVIADGLDSRFHVFKRTLGPALVNSVPTMLQGVVHDQERENAPMRKVVGGDFDNDGDGDLLGLQNLQSAQVTQMVFGRTAPLSRVQFLCDYEHVSDGRWNDRPSSFATFSVPLQLPNLQPWLSTGHTMSLEVTTWFRPNMGVGYADVGTRTSHALTATTTQVTFTRPNAGLGLDWSVEIRARMVATKNGISTPLAPYRVHHATAVAEAVERDMDNLQIRASGYQLELLDDDGVGGTGGTTGGTGPSQSPPWKP
jgi:hypothetical protein